MSHVSTSYLYLMLFRFHIPTRHMAAVWPDARASFDRAARMAVTTTRGGRRDWHPAPQRAPCSLVETTAAASRMRHGSCTSMACGWMQRSLVGAVGAQERARALRDGVDPTGRARLSRAQQGAVGIDRHGRLRLREAYLPTTSSPPPMRPLAMSTSERPRRPRSLRSARASILLTHSADSPSSTPTW